MGIILLTGPNSFAISQALKDMTEQFVAARGQHSVERVDGDNCAPNRLPDLLQGASLFAAERMVIMRDASQNKLLWEAIGEWCDKIIPETALVLVEPTPDKRTKTYKLLQKKSDVRQFNDLSERELMSWLQQSAKDAGGTLDSRTAQYLVQRVGVNQWQLWQELQKLLNFRAEITKEAIDDLVEANPQASVFDLLDSALGGKTEAMRQLLVKLRTSEDPYKLFGLLVSQIHTLALVAAAGDRSADEIAKLASMHPFVVRKSQALAGSFDKAQLQKIIEAVTQLDTQLKTTGGDPWLLVEQALGKIATR